MSLFMTLPVSTALNERLFSSLKLVKTYLRLTMGDNRLNGDIINLLVISVENEEASKIDLYKYSKIINANILVFLSLKRVSLVFHIGKNIYCFLKINFPNSLNNCKTYQFVKRTYGIYYE